VIDGVHHCLDAVTGSERCAAVLIRALQPVGNTKAPAVGRRHVGLDVHNAERLLTEPELHVPIEAVGRPRSGARSAGERAGELPRSSS
jgi:3-methyladenine DNA glycosylase Mpg